MDAERPFLDCELSLDDLARRLGVRARDLSQLSSRRYRMTMPALLNQWRLEEAARMLADPNNTAPVTTIMYDAGFGSKSSFQREFQKRFGVSPTAYRVRATSAR
jgi:AraC-like DNA-binding protein